MDKKYHKILLGFGSLLWIVGFFLAVGSIYPYAFVGIYLGPPAVILGIIGWISNYKKTKNQFPNPRRSFKKIVSKYKGIFKYHIAMIEFLFTYVLHFWICCVVFWFALTYTASILFKSSQAFKATKTYVEKDNELINRIGEIQYYGFLIGGSVSTNGDAEISFTAIGEKETIKIKAFVDNGNVIKLEYK